jgi:hypothetical protein
LSAMRACVYARMCAKTCACVHALAWRQTPAPTKQHMHFLSAFACPAPAAQLNSDPTFRHCSGPKPRAPPLSGLLIAFMLRPQLSAKWSWTGLQSAGPPARQPAGLPACHRVGHLPLGPGPRRLPSPCHGPCPRHRASRPKAHITNGQDWTLGPPLSFYSFPLPENIYHARPPYRHSPRECTSARMHIAGLPPPLA